MGSEKNMASGDGGCNDQGRRLVRGGNAFRQGVRAIVQKGVEVWTFARAKSLLKMQKKEGIVFGIERGTDSGGVTFCADASQRASIQDFGKNQT